MVICGQGRNQKFGFGVLNVCSQLTWEITEYQHSVQCHGHYCAANRHTCI